MLKPRNWIYWIFIFCIILSIVRADDEDSEDSGDSEEGDSSTECDSDDTSCFGKSMEIATSSNSSIFIRSSNSVGGPAKSTSFLTAAAAPTEILSDFHEAKVVKHPNTPQNPDNTLITNKPVGPTFQDDINQDHDLGSSGDGMPVGNVRDEDTRKSALNNVEAGVLSACGVLVVAGIAVGIFVWKNTTGKRNIQHDRIDMENQQQDQQQNDDNDSNMKGSIYSTSKKPSFESIKYLQRSINVNLPSLSFDRDDFFSSWQRRNSRYNMNFDFEPKQKSPINIITTTTPIISEQELFKKSFEHTLFTSESEPILSSLNQQQQQQQYEPLSAITTKKERKINTSPRDNNEKHNIFLLSANHLVNSVYGPMFGGASSPQLRGNINTIPSAMDPAFDPTALTWPLQKFLRDGIVASNPYSSSSPMQISINLSSEEEAEIEEESQNVMNESSSSNNSKRDGNNNSTKEHFGYQLNKFLSSSKKAVKREMINLQRHQQQDTTTTTTATTTKRRKVLSDNKENNTAKTTTTTTITTEKVYQELYNKMMMKSPLDLPNNEYIPLRNSKIEPPGLLVSRAEVLADPKRRLGQDEIALWENKHSQK